MLVVSKPPIQKKEATPLNRVPLLENAVSDSQLSAPCLPEVTVVGASPALTAPSLCHLPDVDPAAASSKCS